MKLWKIERTDHVGYDEYDSAIVRADNAEQALTLLVEDLNAPEFRQNPKNFTITELTASGTYGVVIASFNAG